MQTGMFRENLGIHPRPAIAISDLRHKPEFFDTVADRIWRVWWKERGHSLESIANRLRETLDARPIPFALAAHHGTTYAGSALVIASDMEECPQYSPWIAAVWVANPYRKQGIGAALVDQAAHATFSLGINRVYLCASRQHRDYYLRREWTQIEEDVGAGLLTVMTRKASGTKNSTPINEI